MGQSWASISNTISILIIPAIMTGIIRSSQPVFFLVAQYTVLRGVNPGQQNVAEVVGVALIVLGNVSGPTYQLYRDVKQGEWGGIDRFRLTEDEDKDEEEININADINLEIIGNG